MKAISIHQPYAALLLHGKIMTRTWSTKYRGPVLICATMKSLKLDEILAVSGERHYWRIIDKIIAIMDKQEFPALGHAIAIGELVDCHLMYRHLEDACFRELDTQLYCHVYANVRAITPIPVKGQQRYFNVQISADELNFITTPKK